MKKPNQKTIEAMREADEMVRANKVMKRVRKGKEPIYTLDEAMKELNKDETTNTEPRHLDDCEILHIALASGFQLKEQPDKSLSLHPYVWHFAKAIEKRAIANAAGVTVIDGFLQQDPSSIPTTDEHNAMLLEQIEELRESLHSIAERSNKLFAEHTELKAENAYHYAALVDLIKAGLNVMSEFQKTNPEVSGSLYLALQEFNKKLYVDKFKKEKP